MRKTIPALGCLFALTAPALPAQRLPIWYFTRPASYGAVHLSPDGSTLGFISRRRNDDAGQALFFSDLATGRIAEVEAPPVDNALGSMVVKQFTWVNRHRVIFTADLPFSEYLNTAGAAAVDRDGTNWRLLSGSYGSQGQDPFLMTNVMHVFGGSSDEVLMLQIPTISVKNPLVMGVNTLTGNYWVVADDREGMNGWVADQNGNVRIGISFDDDETRVIYRPNDQAAWRPLHDFDAHGTGSYPLAIDFDGMTAYVAALTPSGTWGIYQYDLEAQKRGPLVLADSAYDILNPNDPFQRAGLLFSKLKHRLVGVRYLAALEKTVWFDDGLRQLQAMLDRALPGAVNSISGWSDDERRLLIRSWSDRQPGVYYLFDRANGQLRRLFDTAPWIRPALMAPVLPLQYRARDGLLIHGYITFPRGTQRRNLPLVMLPHGGPWVRDAIGFDPLVQFLANRGYAVLQVNYRGSPGYGDAFSKAGYRQIGKAIQDDITDGVKWAIRSGTADPRRIAIVGASYGGYSVEWALTNTPELYRCGVSVAGVSDWLAIIKARGHHEADSPAYDYWKDQIGDPDTDEAVLREISPINHLDRMKAPIFVVHGEQDFNVPVSQARRLIAGLKARGLPYEEMIRPNEGHSLFLGRDHDILFARMQAFLDKNMQPEGPPPGGAP